MRIWYVTGQNANGVFEHHFAATKPEAKKIAKDIEDGSDHKADIDTYDVTPTRAGITEALNSFAEILCINEG